MKNSEKGSISIILIVVIIVALVAGAFVFVTSSDDSDGDQNTESQSQTDESTTDTGDQASDDSDESSYEEVNLEAINGQTGEGVAIRSIGGGDFTHELYIQTTEPPAGKFYEGWLVGDSVISTGKLEKNSEGVWYLKYTSTEDLSGHKQIVVTEESESQGLDGKPETHIFEGTF